MASHQNTLMPASSEHLLSGPYGMYTPLPSAQYSNESNNASNFSLLATTAVATVCVAAATYVVANQTSASTDGFVSPMAKMTSKMAMRASRQDMGPARATATKKQGAQKVGKQQRIKAALVAGATAAALQGNAQAYDMDLFSDLSTMEYETNTQRGSADKYRKDEDAFKSFLKASKTAPTTKAEKPKVEPKVVEVPKVVEEEPKAEATDLFAMFKKDAQEQPKVAAPKVEEPKAEAPKTEGTDLFAMFRKEAAEEPVVEAPKVEEDKAEGTDLFAFFKKEVNEEVAVPKVEEPKAEAPKTEGTDLFAMFKKEAPEEPVVVAPKVEAKAEAPKTEGTDLFAMFKKEVAEEAVAPAAPVVAPKEVKKAPEPKAPVVLEKDDPFAAFLAAPIEELPKPAPVPAKVKVANRVRAAPEAPKPQVVTPKAASGDDSGSLFVGIGAGAASLLVAAVAFLLSRSTPAKRAQAKAVILDAIDGTNRGFNVSEDEEIAILKTIQALEKQNPTANPVNSVLIDGKWELLFSTSPDVLGKSLNSKPKATFEIIDMDACLLKREQVLSPLPFIKYSDTKTNVLDVVNTKKVTLMKGDAKVVKTMKRNQTVRGTLRGSVGQASDAGATVELGEFTTTYLDDTWRVARSQDGEVSVFRRDGVIDDSDDEEEDIERPAPVKPAPVKSAPVKSAPISRRQRPQPVVAEPKPEKPKFSFFVKPQPAEEDEEEEVVPKPARRLPKFEVPKFPQAKSPAAQFQDDDEEAIKPASKLPKFEVPKFDMPNFPSMKGAAPAPEVEEEEEEEPVPAAKSNPLAGLKLPDMPDMPRVPDASDFNNIVEQLQKGPEGLKALATGKSSAPAASEEDAKPSPDEAKKKLFALIEGVDRGLSTTLEQSDKIEAAIQEVEALNPTENPLASPLINGKWELLYTTSEAVLGKELPKPLQPKGPIYQYIDTDTGRATNQQTIQPVDAIPALAVTTSVSAELTAETDNRLGVKFDEFTVGPMKLESKGDSNAKLVVTYLDEDLRISRGSRGNVFVLRMADRDDRQFTAK